MTPSDLRRDAYTFQTWSRAASARAYKYEAHREERAAQAFDKLADAAQEARDALRDWADRLEARDAS